MRTIRQKKEKVCAVLVALLVAGLLIILTACEIQPGPEPDPTPALNGDISGSVLMFDKIKNNDKLLDDIGEDRAPKECKVMYDVAGDKPEVTLTEPDDVMRIVQIVGEIKVGSKSDEEDKGSCNYVRFTLKDGTKVSYDFEGEELIRAGKEKYEVSDSSELWAYVRTLQDEVER